MKEKPDIVLVPRRWFLTVNVSLPDGKIIAVKLEPSDTVDYLKEAISAIVGTPPDNQRIIYDHRQLEDGRTMADYRVHSGCTMHLVHRLRGGMMHETSGRDGYGILDTSLICVPPTWSGRIEADLSEETVQYMSIDGIEECIRDLVSTMEGME